MVSLDPFSSEGGGGRINHSTDEEGKAASPEEFPLVIFKLAGKTIISLLRGTGNGECTLLSRDELETEPISKLSLIHI